MSGTGRSHQGDRRPRSSRPDQHRIARQSDRSYDGTSGNNSSRNTGGYANGTRNNLTNSPALQDYLERSQRDNPWAPENARHAYGEYPDNTHNNSYNSASGNGGYNYSSGSRQYNDPYSNAQRDNAYNNPYNNARVDSQYENPYNRNTANGSSGPTSYANRNGGYTNGESSNARFSNNYGNDYDTTDRRSSNSENNHHNTSTSRSRNSHTSSRR